MRCACSSTAPPATKTTSCTEITFVNYVRDRTLADVHVLITTQATGGGGTEYTLKFIGLERFKGLENTLTYSASQTSTADERRRGLVSMLKLGLVGYVADSPLASRLKVTFDPPPNQQQATAASDPWNFWVFRIGASGEVEAEEQNNQRDFSSFFFREPHDRPMEIRPERHHQLRT